MSRLKNFCTDRASTSPTGILPMLEVSSGSVPPWPDVVSASSLVLVIPASFPSLVSGAPLLSSWESVSKILTGAPGMLLSGKFVARDSPLSNECTWTVKFKLGSGNSVLGDGSYPMSWFDGGIDIFGNKTQNKVKLHYKHTLKHTLN